jgi:NADH:ubiquinone oxidoreductase subunit 3 (subunit A)|tara:strand:- start:2540 stop:2926 length:387 start_codon:yes stop_codon:yes gene_type:complete
LELDLNSVENLLIDYLPVLIAAVIAFFLVFSALIGSRLLAPFSTEKQKSDTYECGMIPIRSSNTNIGIRFYFYAILFVIFDVEALFIFPWAVSFIEIGPESFVYMSIFILILLVGLAYAWKKGALSWR